MKELTEKEREFLNYLRVRCFRIRKKGYIYYRNAKTNKSYKRSRVLYQIYYNVKLTPLDIIHHKDKNKENDHIENLELTTQEEHISIHFTGIRKRKNKPRRKSNKLSEEKQEEIKRLSKIIIKSDGNPNYSQIGKKLNIAGFTVAKYI